MFSSNACGFICSPTASKLVIWDSWFKEFRVIVIIIVKPDKI